MRYYLPGKEKYWYILITSLAISGFWENALLGELILRGVGAALDDAICIGVADAGEGFELGGSCGVDVESVAGGGGVSFFRCGSGRFGSPGLLRGGGRLHGAGGEGEEQDWAE